MNIVEAQTSQALEEANELVENIALTAVIKVNSMPTFEKAKGMLGELRVIKKEIADKKSSIVKPLSEALKNVRALFKPVEENIETIENDLKREVLNYNNKLIAEQKEREAKALEEIRKGKTMEEATKSVERVNQKIEQIKTRKVARLNIINEALIPRDYLTPATPKIMADLKEGIKVEGCELVYDEIAINNY